MATFSSRGALTVAVVLLGTAAGVMVALLFYALLVTEPSAAYVVGVLATAGVTGWAALECLGCDRADRSGDGHPIRRSPPLPSGKPGGPGGEQGGPVHAPVRPVQVSGTDRRNSSSFFRRPPTR
jgi:hypothetical protein